MTGPSISGLTFLEPLGEGGYADVYLYERRSPRMKVAIKVLKDGRLAPAEVAQFEAEAEAMAELSNHPYIVQVFSADRTSDGRPYLMMKYYPRPNLAVRARKERFSAAEVLRTGVRIASAVETAHRAGIIHRDIKPANILVSQYGDPGLSDFGIAGRGVDDGENLGVSIPWSPPEVLSGESNGSVQSDVYSLAATLWTLLAGRSPFEEPGSHDQQAMMRRVLSDAPRPTGRADIPTSLERLLQQAMAKRPSGRPRTALELAQALQGIEQEQRLDRTTIVVDDEASARSLSVLDERDETRVRLPKRIDAQQQLVDVASVPSHVTPDDDRSATRTRLRPPVDDGSTRARNVEGAQPTAPGHARRTVLALVAIGVVALVVLAVVIASNGGGHPSAAPPSVKATDQTDAPVVPAIPRVSATYEQSRHKVVFRWHVAGARPGDAYLWAYPHSEPTRTRHTSVSLPTREPHSTCIQVQYVPADTGTPSAPSATTCGPAS